MFHFHLSLFSKTKSLENEIDQFHDKLIDASMTFIKAIKIYLKEQRSEAFIKSSKDIKDIERAADALRRSIENSLYANNLIPDLRADVLQLTESFDRVINKFDEVTYMFYIERPELPEQYHHAIKELCKLSADCAENMCKASRAFFRDLSSVRDYSQKVYFIEHESDHCLRLLLEEIFSSELHLSNKLQLKQFLTDIANIADLAEDFIDELLIFTIKRDI
jgi:predicted phosphate transport protein (TIGR00153 family)